MVFAWNVVLFTIWHIGYMVSNILSGNWNAVIRKLAAGLREWCGFESAASEENCYATVLAYQQKIRICAWSARQAIRRDNHE